MLIIIRLKLLLSTYRKRRYFGVIIGLSLSDTFKMTSDTSLYVVSYNMYYFVSMYIYQNRY